MMHKGFIVFEDGQVWPGRWLGGENRAGELVFNTSQCGYEEIATDPSYYSQIMIMTSAMQGNYGSRPSESESGAIWIRGFVALEIQNSSRDCQWVERLTKSGVPLIDSIDTRSMVLKIREQGTPWGAILKAASESEAKSLANTLISAAKAQDSDWCFQVSRKNPEYRKGLAPQGPRVAVLDFGCKENILREVAKLSSEVAIFGSRTSAIEIEKWNPHGILLSNGPGDPGAVKGAVKTIQDLLGRRPIFGICMGHQLLSLALGAKTYKLKFGHRGGNHPVRDDLVNQIYMTSQNHGYAVDASSLPSGTRVTQTNLYDGTVEGIQNEVKKCFSVQYHPESHPGPNEAAVLFKYFREMML